MIVIASYYVLFAAMSGSVQTVIVESIVMTGFATAAFVGFKSSAWIVVGALAGLVFRVRRRRCSLPCVAHTTRAQLMTSRKSDGDPVYSVGYTHNATVRK